MREIPANDHLDLWRGIDDAVWREAARAARAPRRATPAPTAGTPDPKPARSSRAVAATHGKLLEPV